MNLPGVLRVGDLASTTAVSIGRGNAIFVDNTSTGATASVSLAGPLAVSAPLNLGTNSVTCGAVSSGAITASGSVSCGTNPMTCGALSSGAIVASGSVTCGTNPMTCGALSSGAIAASGGVTCGANAMTSGAIASGAHTVAGTLSCGTSGMTCGALSCASVASTGDVTQPRYSLRLYKAAGQTLSNNTITAIVWDTIETTGGGATNWPYTPPSAAIVIPVSGRYVVEYTIGFAANASNYRETWIEVNVGGVPGSSQRYGEDVKVPVTGSIEFCNGTFTYQFAANDTIVAAGFQGSGGGLSVPGLAGNQGSSLSITRLSE